MLTLLGLEYPHGLICKPTFCSSHRADGPGPGPNVHHGRTLQPWNPEVGTFGHSYRKHSLNSVIHDCSFTSIDCKADLRRCLAQVTREGEQAMMPS